MTSIGLSRITHCYQKGQTQRVCKDLDLEFAQGEFVVIVGPSGCGKSTLLRIIAGLERPSEGQVWFGGEDVTFRSARERNVAMVFQSYALYPHLSVRENLELTLKIARVSKAERDERVLRVARFLEIEELLAKRPAQLSGGQKQRVAMGRALVREPAVFLFDEPLSNLDAELRGRLREQIKKLHREFPATKVYVTHDQVEAMTLADRIVVLSRGEIQQIGTPSEIYSRPANTFVAQFFGSPQMNLLPLRDVLSLIQGEALAEPLRAMFRMRPGAQVGMRPEDLHVVESEAPGLDAVVTDFENLGASYVMSCATGAGTVRVTGASSGSGNRNKGGRPEYRYGDRLRLGLETSRLHWFHESTGERLESF